MKLAYLIVIALVTSPTFLVQAQDDIDEKSPPAVPVIEAIQAEGEAINREDSGAGYGEPIVGGNGPTGPNYGPPRLQVQPISGGYGSPVSGGQIIIRQPTQGYGIPQPYIAPGGGISGGYGSPQIQPIRYNAPIYNTPNYNAPISSYGVPSFRHHHHQNFYRAPTVGFGSINTINYPRFIHGGNGGGGYGNGGFNFQRHFNFRPHGPRYNAPVISGGYS